MADQLAGALQENLLTLVAYNDEYCQLVRNAVDPNLFSTFVYRDIVQNIYAYIDQFHKAPKDHLPDLLEDQLKKKDDKAEVIGDILHNVHELSDSLNAEYVVGQLEKFIRQQQLKLGIIEATEAVQKGDLDSAQNALEASLKNNSTVFNPGLSLLDGLHRVHTHQHDRDTIILGIPELDKRELGPGKKELHLFLAPPKRGKTWWLIHNAKRALMQRLKVCVVTLEMSEDRYAQRLLQNLLSLSRREAEIRIPTFDTDDLDRLIGIGHRIDKSRPVLSRKSDLALIESKLTKLRFHRNLLVKAFPTRSLSVNGLKAYLDSLERMHRFVPDVLILDYADLMKVNTNNYRIELGALYAELRGIAVERNLALVTASQANREGAKSQLITDTNVAEDYSKIAISDCVMSYNQTKEEKRLGLARVYVTSGRNEEDKFAVLVSQAYALGQFALESRKIETDYWNIMEASSREAEQNEE